MGKILVNIITIGVTLALMGIGTYVYITMPKIHSFALKNQHGNSITISK